MVKSYSACTSGVKGVCHGENMSNIVVKARFINKIQCQFLSFAIPKRCVFDHFCMSHISSNSFEDLGDPNFNCSKTFSFFLFMF